MIPPKEVIDYVKAGKKIPAIKLVRDITGMSLKEAKYYVDNLEREIKNNVTTTKRLSQESKRLSRKTKTLSQETAIFAIDRMNGHEFEYFCADLLRNIGFTEVIVTPGSGDQGVDVLAQKDGIKYAIQCKNYAKALSNTPVQEVSAGKQYYGCHVGVVLTNSTFTPGAIQLAGATNVLLWDRKKLIELIEMAGGVSKLGLYFESDDLYDDYEEDDDFVEDYNDEAELVPMVGGISNLEVCLESDDLDNDYEEDAGFVEDLNMTVTVDLKQGKDIVLASNTKPRKGMMFFSKLFLAWSIVCLLVIFIGLVSEELYALCFIGLGEGVFFLVLGLMFKILAKSEKKNPYIYWGRRRVKKSLFVFICIVVAFALCSPAMNAADDLSKTDASNGTTNQIVTEKTATEQDDEEQTTEESAPKNDDNEAEPAQKSTTEAIIISNKTNDITSSKVTNNTTATSNPTAIVNENTEVIQIRNDIGELEKVIANVCKEYNLGNTLYGGQLFATVNSATSVTVEHYVKELVPASDAVRLNEIEDFLEKTFHAALNEVFPEKIDVYVYTTATIIEDEKEELSSESGDLDGIITEEVEAVRPQVKNWISNEGLQQYGLACAWMGEVIWVWEQSDSDNKYIIEGSPKSHFEKGIEYVGDYNGYSIRFKYTDGVELYFSDLVEAGIIK